MGEQDEQDEPDSKASKRKSAKRKAATVAASTSETELGPPLHVLSAKVCPLARRFHLLLGPL